MPKPHPARLVSRLAIPATLLAFAGLALPMGVVVAADTSAPSVEAPVLSTSTSVAGTEVTLTASAADDSAVASAQVNVDGGPWTALTAPGGSFGAATVDLAGSVGTAGVSTIAVGPLHGCALLGDANLRCWGWNYFGQLGDGTSGVSSLERRSAVGVPDLSGVTAVGLGDHHSCALLADGAVRCWGHNFAGQLGDGTTTDRLAPVAVAGLSGATALAVGSYHNCAILPNTTAVCWGWNSAGELGDGTTTNRDSPVPVPGLSGITAISAGFGFTCALLADTTVRCWGINQSGQVGTGTTTIMYQSPVVVPGLSGVTAISAGERHVCALIADTTVSCWGFNHAGQVGDGTTTDQLSPIQVPGLSDVTTVVAASGGYHTCVIVADASVRCWGADGSGDVRLEPALVAGLSGVTALGAGRGFTCALTADNAFCWGSNDFGQLGGGTTGTQLSPMPVTGLAGHLAAGAHEVCVRATDDSGNTSDGSACAVLTIRHGHTPVGTSISVRFADETGGPSVVRATFSDVTVAGESAVSIGATGPATPGAFLLGDPAIYYTLTTTATFTNAVVCIDVGAVSYTDASELRMYHFVGGEWVEVTYTRDVATSTVCGRTDSFSPFLVVQFRYGDTPIGDSVEVTFADETGAPSRVSATFDGVTVAGESTAVLSAAGPPLPGTFQLGDPAVYYSLSTTATFESAMVCFNFAGAYYSDPTLLNLLHFQGGAWVDVTASLDPWAGTICGVVDSFSPFVVAQLHYAFGGFLAPIDRQPVRNTAKAGSAIPIKFSLGGNGGPDIFETGHPKVETVTCDTQTPLDEIEETVSAGQSGLSYDPANEGYTYIWKTDPKWAGTCRQLVVRLADGSEHRANFSFRR